MTDIHIVCRKPAPYTAESFPDGADERCATILNGIVPSLSDCTVTINGVEATNVESVTWTVRGNEPARAVVTFIGATVDVDAVGPDPLECGHCGLPVEPPDAPSQSRDFNDELYRKMLDGDPIAQAALGMRAVELVSGESFDLQEFTPIRESEDDEGSFPHKPT